MIRFLCFLLLAGSAWAQTFSQSLPVRAQATVASGVGAQLGAFWHLNEATASGGAQTYVDSVGSLNLTVATIGQITAGTGISGNCQFLDAGSAVQGFFCSDNSTIGVGSGKSFTISVWVRIYDNSYSDTDSAAIVSKWHNTFDSGTSANQDYLLANKNNTFRWSVRNLAATRVDLVSSMTWAFQTWYHIACGYDDAAQQIWIQVNGGARDTTACVGVQRTSVGFAIGDFTSTTLPGTGGAITRGDFDEVGFWNRSLSASEVTQIASPWIHPFSISAGTQISTNWDWIVVNKNSGAATGSTTKNSLAAFIDGRITDGTWVNAYSTNWIFWFFPSDNIIAALTPVVPMNPYYAVYEQVQWYTAVNHNFVNGDVTVNGLTGNGSTKYIDTGLNLLPRATKYHSGIIAYIYNHGVAASAIDIGCQDVSGNCFNLMPYIANQTIYDAYNFNLGNGRLIYTPTSGNGFYSGQTTSSTSTTIYFASSGTPHFAVTNSAAGSTLTFPSLNEYIFNLNLSGIPYVAGWSDNTLSYVEFTPGFSPATDALVYTRVQALRTALGGGFR